MRTPVNFSAVRGLKIIWRFASSGNPGLLEVVGPVNLLNQAPEPARVAHPSACPACASLIRSPCWLVVSSSLLTLPVLVPLSDLIGLSRQMTVLAYQYGAGLTNLLWPTNGALMAMLAAAGVSFDAWLRFAVPLLVALFVLAAVAIGVGVTVGV